MKKINSSIRGVFVVAAQPKWKIQDLSCKSQTSQTLSPDEKQSKSVFLNTGGVKYRQETKNNYGQNPFHTPVVWLWSTLPLCHLKIAILPPCDFVHFALHLTTLKKPSKLTDGVLHTLI